MSDPVTPPPNAPPAASRAPAPAPARTIAPPTGPTDPPPPVALPVPGFITTVQSATAGAIEHVAYWVGDWSLIVTAARLLEVAVHLRDTDGARFDLCSDVTATDWPPRPERFDVVYTLYSTRLKHRVRVKVRVGETGSVPSVAAVWPAANWLEREVFDLFGIRFAGHPDLRRILMPDEWQGHPQRKDYPLEGPGEMLLENPIDWLKVQRAGERPGEIE